MLALPLPPGDLGDEHEFALLCNKIAGHMASRPYAVHVTKVPAIIQKFEDYSPRKARLRILHEMCENTSVAVRDPLNYYTVDEIRSIVAEGDTLFYGMSAVQSALQALYLSKGNQAVKREADAIMRSMYAGEETLEVQAGLLLAYFGGARTKAFALEYLMEWFRDCDVTADHAVLEAYIEAGKARGLDTAKTQIEELSGMLQRWRGAEGKTLEEIVGRTQGQGTS
jgi:hypothetical protein